MGNIVETYNRLKSIDIWAECLDILVLHADEIVQLNKDQLWDGKTSENVDISPNYLNDPYFKSKGHALDYAKWKAKITPNSKRGFKVPNFYITGKLVYNTLKAYRTKDYFEITAQGEATNIDQKYKDIYGLTKENIEFIKNKVLPELQTRIRKKLGI